MQYNAATQGPHKRRRGLNKVRIFKKVSKDEDPAVLAKGLRRTNFSTW